MSTIEGQYGEVWQQIRHWPAEKRRSLAEQIRLSLQADLPNSRDEWTEVKNARRCQLIDKDIQESLSETERQELEDLTQQLRAYRRRVAPIPIVGARKLHHQLMEKKRQQDQLHEED